MLLRIWADKINDIANLWADKWGYGWLFVYLHLRLEKTARVYNVTLLVFSCIMLIHQNPEVSRVKKLYLIVKNIIFCLKHYFNLVAVFINQLILSN